jgi:DNA-binding protein YbaB
MNPFELLKNAQAIKENMAKMQEILPTIQATGNAGAGMGRHYQLNLPLQT